MKSRVAYTRTCKSEEYEPTDDCHYSQVVYIPNTCSVCLVMCVWDWTLLADLPCEMSMECSQNSVTIIFTACKGLSPLLGVIVRRFDIFFWTCSICTSGTPISDWCVTWLEMALGKMSCNYLLRLGFSHPILGDETSFFHWLLSLATLLALLQTTFITSLKVIQSLLWSSFFSFARDRFPIHGYSCTKAELTGLQQWSNCKTS